MTETNNTTAIGTRIRLIQITDCHLGPEPEYRLAGITTMRSYRAVLDAISATDVNPELLMVTGDIAAHGAPGAYQVFLDEIADWNFRWLPGNHDDFSLMQSLRVQSFIRVIEIGAWRLISLNTAVPRRVAGRLARAEIQALRESLAAHRESPVAIFMHHPPMDVGCRWLDRQQVANGDELESVLKPFDNVKMVVSGHVHQESSLRFAGIPFYSTPSTCFQFAPGSDDFGLDTRPPGYRWFDLNPDGSFETGVVYLENYPETVDVGVQGY